MDERRKDCYAKNSLAGPFNDDDTFCTLFFDQLLCWPATRAGQVASQPCPFAEIGGLTVSRANATRKCMEDGTWFVNPATNASWSNYTQCNLMPFNETDTALVSFADVAAGTTIYDTLLPVIKLICNYGYWISIVTLLICIIIFASIKKLQCARNILHVHLFMSFIGRALMYFVKETWMFGGMVLYDDLVISSQGEGKYITENYSWICKMIITFRWYFIQANYMFILMEGIYLHNLMFMNLFSENSSVKLYCIFGWGSPLLFSLSWAFLRKLYDDDMCWTSTGNKYISSLIQLPIEGSVLINFLLFISITRVLVLKINSMYLQHKKVKYRRLIRSTLTLVLISGVPFAISVVASYALDDELELIWIFCDQAYIAFQGLLMGLIYCILNGEVQAEIRHKIQSFQSNYLQPKKAHATRTISNTLQFTIPAPYDEPDAGTYQLHKCVQYKTTENL